MFAVEILVREKGCPALRMSVQPYVCNFLFRVRFLKRTSKRHRFPLSNPISVQTQSEHAFCQKCDSFSLILTCLPTSTYIIPIRLQPPQFRCHCLSCGTVCTIWSTKGRVSELKEANDLVKTPPGP